MVASDRLSAFDVVLPTPIPDKGKILNQMSLFWFSWLGVPHHAVTADPSQYPESLHPFADRLQGRSVLVKKAKRIDIECVARGYLAGSGWKDYRASGKVCGHVLPSGLQQCAKLEVPLFTPAAKNDIGHDENISFEEMVGVTGRETAELLREKTLDLYSRARTYAQSRGVILADTKFEFGWDGSTLLLIDEALTPDSSRFWPSAVYAPGRDQPSFDKQYVRDYLETLTWDKNYPGPHLPDDVVERTRDKYLEAYRLLTGETFKG
jgi:phosphoribosylaminoimidazole-succinocarboxamide synthase